MMTHQHVREFTPSTFSTTSRSTPMPFYLPTSSSVSCKLHMGFSVINDTEHAVLRALALLADDGLPATVEELVRPPTQLVSANALRTLHIATALLAHELETGDAGTGEWASVNVLWAQQKHGLPLHLLVILDILTADAQVYFLLIPPPP
ncbi:hypothetical protein BC827DRAFT_225889 [Russula dissimulans]|nr:hypothetical protein BC827DRAFT_225889 [Russula dissimulans]